MTEVAKVARAEKAAKGGKAAATERQASPSAKLNRLLDALPAEDYARIEPELELVDLPLGAVLYEAGGKLGYVYFPTNAIISLLYVMEDGASAEIAVAGCEGLVGIALFMSGETTPSRAVVQSSGQGYRLRASMVKKEFEGSGALHRIVLLYTQALITQMAQTAVCNRHHTVEQQLCRWLLLSLDRLPSNELSMTQDLIANMLGVRREGVTEAAGRLQKAGLIRYSRGRGLTWAQRLKRVFAIDIETCRQCGGRLRVIACIEAPPVIERILSHLGQMPSAADPAHPSRAPPEHPRLI